MKTTKHKKNVKETKIGKESSCEQKQVKTGKIIVI